MIDEDSFYQEIKNESWEEIEKKILAVTEQDVLNVLEKATSGGEIGFNDFVVLISDSAQKYIEQMAQLSRELTIKRFGKTINSFIPMYVSNECSNTCTYCGYSMNNPVPRIILNKDQIMKEVEAIKKMGLDQIVVLTGESTRKVNIDYLEKVLSWIRPYFSLISFEVQPLMTEEYERLQTLGLDGVYVYQETYHEENYKKYHPKGKKSNFRYRLETPERVGYSGIKKIGLGALLGLENPIVENYFLAKHYHFLKQKYWKTKYCISFPRIKKADGINNNIFSYISDTQLVQYICAWRIYQPDIDISISTRENSYLRDHLVRLGVNIMSASSKTSPGGYANFDENTKSLAQFEISDDRPIEEIKQAFSGLGYELVLKDWDRGL